MSVINNKFEGRAKAKSESPLIRPLMILGMILVGLFSFAALIVLMGYGDDLRQKENGQATPTSQSAVGYAGYVQLINSVDFDVVSDSKPYVDDYETRERLRIYTPSSMFKTADLQSLDDDAPKLIILPKWIVTPLKDKTGWVRKHWSSEFMRASDLSLIIGDAGKGIYIHQSDNDDESVDMAVDIKLGTVTAISANLEMESLQYFSSDLPKPPTLKIGKDNDEDATDEDESEIGNKTLEKVVDVVTSITGKAAPKYTAVMSTQDKQALLIKLPDSRTYVLSDPDFVNTQGLALQSRARLAVDILETIIKREELDPQAVTFDLSLHGIESKPNLIKLMTQPPFLAATLCLLAAGGLIAWQGFARFGDPRVLPADYSHGPASLAKTSAGFLASANRLGSMGGAYAELTRRQVIKRLGLFGQSAEMIDTALQARETQRDIIPTFEHLTNTPPTVDAMGFTTRASALAQWKKEMIREHYDS